MMILAVAIAHIGSGYGRGISMGTNVANPRTGMGTLVARGVTVAYRVE